MNTKDVGFSGPVADRTVVSQCQTAVAEPKSTARLLRGYAAAALSGAIGPEDAAWFGASLNRLADTTDELVAALRLARSELAGLPHSLGYSFTHLPKIDAAIAKATGAQP